MEGCAYTTFDKCNGLSGGERTKKMIEVETSLWKRNKFDTYLHYK